MVDLGLAIINGLLMKVIGFVDIYTKNGKRH